MSGTFAIGRLFGVRVRVHFSWIFIFALIAWSLASSWLPSQYFGWGRAQYWTVGIVGSALLFVCVLIHELSHSLEAIRRGRKVRSITLFFLGGVSEIEDESKSAGEEFWVSIVGPLTSLGLGALFWLMYLNLRSGAGQLTALTQYLMIVNLAIGVFNLFPAFPLDGGRVLRALVWRATNSHERATRVASFTGSALGFGLIGLGIVFVFTNSLVTGIWLVFIGWFIQSAASSVRRDEVEKQTMSGRTVGDAMEHTFPKVAPGITVQDLLDDYISKDFRRAYLVVLGDTFQGLITATDVRGVPAEQRAVKWVSEVMTKAADVLTLPPDAPLEDGLRVLAQRNIHQLVVVDSGMPVGLLTRAGVLRVMEISDLLAREEAREQTDNP
ncbi:MAG: site-2 protease family protein [Dehalococcoidia bacterium]|nr:site-2 protease family protein [Dehalococcoidia bacterium]